MKYPYNSLYAAPWCPAVLVEELAWSQSSSATSQSSQDLMDLMPKHKKDHYINLFAALDDVGKPLSQEKVDYFWNNDDLISYLLENGNKPLPIVEEKVEEVSKLPYLHLSITYLILGHLNVHM